jgi:hypothetical protein
MRGASLGWFGTSIIQYGAVRMPGIDRKVHAREVNLLTEVEDVQLYVFNLAEEITERRLRGWIGCIAV